ncbi:MAG TPA: hypothetical protein VGG28_06915 [Kofleriaceae bacterium]|jgi:hypothetical protein
MKRVALAIVASCASPPPPPALHNTPPIVPATATALEGRVLDSVTGEPIAGILVEAEGSAASDDAYSDEHGRFHVELAAGSAYVHLEADPGGWMSLAANQVTQRDLRFDHGELEQRRTRRPPAACPSSPPGAIIEGHTTSQAELDAIARRVLERYAADPKTVPDGELAHDIRLVRTDLERHRHLGAAALPPGFVGKTRAELAAEPARVGSDVYYVDVRAIDADPTCAIVEIGTDFVAVPQPGAIKMCCCSASQIYELRGGRWEFVGNAVVVCS